MQLLAIFNQVTSFQQSNVTPAPAIICAHLKSKNINPQYFSFSGCSGSDMYGKMSLFLLQRTTELLVVSAAHANATNLSSSGTCCDTDLERSSCCRPEDGYNENSPLKFAHAKSEMMHKKG